MTELAEQRAAYRPFWGRVMPPFLRFSLLAVLLFFPAVKAWADHFHHVPIEDSRYNPPNQPAGTTLSDIYGDTPLERWIVFTGTDTFSYFDDAHLIYGVTDGFGSAEAIFDFPYFEDVNDPTVTAYFEFNINLLPGSGDSGVPQTIEVGLTDLATQIKWDEGQGTVSGTKLGVGRYTVSNLPPIQQGQPLPWTVQMFYNFHDQLFTLVYNSMSVSWRATGTVNPFSNFFNFPGTDPDNLDIYPFVQCEDVCEVEVFDWGLMRCDTQGGTVVDSDHCGSPDLAITKDDGQTTVVPGQSLTYTLTASNLGPLDATGVSVTDSFPATLSCTWSCAGSGGGVCATGSSTGDIDDTVDLPVGSQAVYTATCTLDPSATGSLTNTATISGSNDPAPGNNTATDTDGITPVADLGIIKNDGQATAVAGGAVSYVIRANNYGPSDASGATVSDAFPAALACNWSCFGTGGASCPASGSGPIAASVDLPVGSTATFLATCAIAPAATGTLVNTATLSPPSGVTDPFAGNDSATDSDSLTPQVKQTNLGILNNDGQATAVAGGSVRYVVTAINFGPSDVAGAMVSDAFPAALDCDWSCFVTAGASCPVGGSGDIAVPVDLPADSTASFFATCAIDPAFVGTLVNVATISPPGGVGDPSAGNNSAADSDTISLAAAAVPALGGRGPAALLATLLAGLGWFFLRRR